MTGKRIVVKVGSNVITRGPGKLDVTRMSALVDQVAWLRAKGYEVILVSSGAVASGRGQLKIDHKLDNVEQRQLFSAVGQVKLINLYYDLFREYGIPVGQVLTMKESFATRREYLNQRACMGVMLDNGVLPIVNENDTISVTELMFTDNDELSGLIAAMMDAQTLVILSNIDGIFTARPDAPEAKLIPTVEPDRDLSEYISQEKSSMGRGGMTTKYNIARKVADEGITVIIANGKRDNILVDLIERPSDTPHTKFIASNTDTSNMKRWIAHSASFAKGVVHINDKAAEKILGDKAASLLLVGVTAIDGDFEEGDIITIADKTGRKVGVGRTAYSSDDARSHIGQHDMRPLVHYDYLCLD